MTMPELGQSYAVRRSSSVEDHLRELRYACRSLALSPGFAATAILILALGIGMTASVFSVAEPLLSRTLPVPNAERVVIFRAANLYQAEYTDRVPDALFHHLAEESSTLSGVLGLLPLPDRAFLEPDTTSDRAQVHVVTGAYFSVLGVNTIVGRTLSETDGEAGAPHVAVISHRLWQRHFSGDPGAVGQTIRLAQPNGGFDRSVTVVGVAPSGFHGVDVDSDPDVWVPFQALYADGVRLGGLGGVRVMGRLVEGTTLAALQAEIDLFASQLSELDLGSWRGQIGQVRFVAEPGGRGYSRVRYEFFEPVVALSGAVGVVLLIVWVNLAALMLGRAAFRRSELAIRLALGSDRRRVVGLFLREGLILAAAGGSLGLVFAFWGTEFLASWLPPETALAGRIIRPGWRALVFTGGVSTLGVMLFALLPGLKAAHMVISLPAAGAAGRSGRRGAFATGHRLAVVMQIAFSLALLIGAGLFLRTLGNLRGIDPGFGAHEVLQFEVESSGALRLSDFADVVLDRIGGLPGVQSTSYVVGTQELLQEDILVPPLQLSLGPGGSTISARQLWVGPRFFETVGIPLLRGETLREGMSGGPDVRVDGVSYAYREGLVLSADLAERLFEGEDPIGRSLFTQLAFFDPGVEMPEWYELVGVVGVVGDVRHLSLRDEPDLTAYRFIGSPQRFLVRADGDAAALIPTVHRVIEEFDPEVRVTNAMTLAQIRDASIAPERFVARIATLFALASLILAAIGTYGVFSCSAALRRAELGIRMALGAGRSAVIALFMREAVGTIGSGVVLGLMAVLATARLVGGMLFGVTPMDPLSVLAATLVLAVTAAFAVYLPARRASRLDPMAILREE
jgi:predicted permease